MRCVFAILTLFATAVRAISGTTPDLTSDEDKLAKDHVLISSGPFKFAAKDHPEADTRGRIVGTG
jgi:hypothetical protein